MSQGIHGVRGPVQPGALRLQGVLQGEAADELQLLVSWQSREKSPRHLPAHRFERVHLLIGEVVVHDVAVWAVLRRVEAVGYGRMRRHCA